MEIIIPVEVQVGNMPHGSFCADSILLNNEVVPLVNGFRVENADVGTLVPLANEVGVLYTHNKPAQNRVFFHAGNGKFSVVNIVNVPIHTHQSITQGGPAFGTYFRDKNS